jgi:hypothetical protein
MTKVNIEYALVPLRNLAGFYSVDSPPQPLGAIDTSVTRYDDAARTYSTKSLSPNWVPPPCPLQ